MRRINTSSKRELVCVPSMVSLPVVRINSRQSRLLKTGKSLFKRTVTVNQNTLKQNTALSKRFCWGGAKGSDLYSQLAAVLNKLLVDAQMPARGEPLC